MRPRLYGSLILVLLVAVGTCYYYFGLLLPSAVAGGYSYGGDFYPLWLTGRELGEGMLFLIFPWIAVLLSLLVLVLSAWRVRSSRRFYSHWGEPIVGLGACWRPIPMNGRCYKPLVAVAMIRDVDEPEQSQSQPILFLRLHGGRAGSHGGRKGLIDSACSPQMVQKNRQFAGHDHAPNPEFLPPLLGLQDMPANHCENCLSQIPDPGAIFLTCVVESKII